MTREPMRFRSKRHHRKDTRMESTAGRDGSHLYELVANRCDTATQSEGRKAPVTQNSVAHSTIAWRLRLAQTLKRGGLLAQPRHLVEADTRCLCARPHLGGRISLPALSSFPLWQATSSISSFAPPLIPNMSTEWLRIQAARVLTESTSSLEGASIAKIIGTGALLGLVHVLTGACSCRYG